MYLDAIREWLRCHDVGGGEVNKILKMGGKPIIGRFVNKWGAEGLTPMQTIIKGKNSDILGFYPLSPISRWNSRKEGDPGTLLGQRETFAIIVYFWKPLTVIAKGSILDTTRVPDLRGMCFNNSVYLTQKMFQKETYQKGIGICFLLV